MSFFNHTWYNTVKISEFQLHHQDTPHKIQYLPTIKKKDTKGEPKKEKKTNI